MNIKEYANTLKQLDDIIQSNNKSMIDAITTKSGNINKNPNLDGFIAEQLHVNSFNRDSVLKDSNYRAEALVPKAGQTYGKNSVDVVIRGNKNNIIQRYQVKYGKTAEDTINMIKKGNYNNQRLVVPHGQVEAVKKAFPGKTVVSEIEFNNIKSESLSKLQAKDIQEKSQSSNNILLEDWNSFNTKDLATKIGTDIGKTALYGMAIGAGFYVADKIINEEEIEMKELVKVSLQTGSDAGMKAAISSAIKVGAEKEIIKCIPKGTPASTISNIVYIGVENAKIVKRVYDGELTLWRGMDEIEKTTISIGVGIIGSNVGSTIGGTIGSILGPGGTMVGAFIGGTVGYMAGSEVGNSIAKGYQKTRRYLCEKIIETTESIKDLYSYNVNSYATLKA
jgi:outer membrane lipoprotein SlyB